MEHSVPSMWIQPAEYERVFSGAVDAKSDETGKGGHVEMDDHVEVTSKDMTKRCLELLAHDRRS